MERFIIEQVLRVAKPPEAYFWATVSGAELDLFFLLNGKRWGVEFKFADAPVLTRSMSIATQDLQLSRLWVVYPGNQEYPLADGISVLPAREITTFGRSCAS